MAARKRETVTVVSQEQLADGIFSMWIQTEAAKTARPGHYFSPFLLHFKSQYTFSSLYIGFYKNT